MMNPEDLLPAAGSPDEPHRGERFGDRPASRQPRELLHLALPADTVSISVARAGLRRWLVGWSWPEDQLDDIVLAVNEAVANAVEHAYPDQPSAMVDIRGAIQQTPPAQRRVTIIVRDHGRWRPPPLDDEHRRRGIPIMQGCMDSVTIGQPDNDSVGTWVVLRSKAVPLPNNHC